MITIYFLSIQQQYVSMILNREKLWEFRKNPRFGILNDKELQAGDIIYLVSRFPDGVTARIDCMCRVLSVLRAEKLKEHFSGKESGRWKQAGCADNSERDWNFFEKNILNVFATGIQLESYKVEPAFDIAQIRHKTKDTPWNAIGLNAACNLRKYHIAEAEVERYFEEMASKLLRTNHCY